MPQVLSGEDVGLQLGPRRWGQSATKRCRDPRRQRMEPNSRCFHPWVTTKVIWQNSSEAQGVQSRDPVSLHPEEPFWAGERSLVLGSITGANPLVCKGSNAAPPIHRRMDGRGRISF